MQLAIAVTVVLACAAAASTTAQPPTAGQPLRVVSSIDLGRYAGKWYEVARLPNDIQRRCASDVVAHYSTRPGGGMNIVNRCRRPDGQIDETRGIARTAGNRKNSAALQVRFRAPILSFLSNAWGEYWIIGLGPDYTWAVVGVPSRETLWILSRTPEMSASAYEQAIEIAKGNGFNTSALLKTAHSQR